MSKPRTVPDAWDDDDWEAQADRADNAPSQLQPTPERPMTKAERIAKHKEEQRQIWESAEAPKEPVNYLVATSTPPLATAFKPPMKLLSRKPAPKSVLQKDPITGLEKLVLVDDEDEEEPKYQPTPDEIRQRQQRELEEKQRRYNEARAKIFGEPSSSPQGAASGTVTPPGDGRNNYRGRGGRGGRGGAGDYRNNNNNNARQEDQTRRAPVVQQPVTQQQPVVTRELYDPSYAPKPAFHVQRRGGDASPQQQSGSRSGTPRAEDQIIRAPRGPDGSGRGGFGFARGGAHGL